MERQHYFFGKVFVNTAKKRDRFINTAKGVLIQSFFAAVFKIRRQSARVVK